MLEAYRAAVLDQERASALIDALADAGAAGSTVEGLGYRKLPAGIDAAHPRVELLRHNALHATFEESLPASLLSRAFVDHCVARFRPLASLLAWVAEL